MHVVIVSTASQTISSQELNDLSHIHQYLLHCSIVGDWNAKVGSQETRGVTGKFGLGIWNEAGQRLIEFAKKMHWS